MLIIWKIKCLGLFCIDLYIIWWAIKVTADGMNGLDDENGGWIIKYREELYIDYVKVNG